MMDPDPGLRKFMGDQDLRRQACSLGSDVRCAVIALIAVTMMNLGDTAKFPILESHQRMAPGSIPVDPAGGHRYWNPIKTCESRVFGTRQTAQ